MKRFVAVLVTCLSLILCSVIVLAEDVNPAPNIVSNPGFEDGDGGNVYGWTSGSWDNNGKFSWVDNQKQTGKKSVCIENGTPTDSRYKQQISVKGNTVYLLSCWVKTENVGMQNIGANLSVEGLFVISPDVKGTSGEWKKVELYGRTAKGQENLTVTVGLGGYGSLNSGTAWFDDISVEELKSVPANTKVVNLFNTSEGAAGAGGHTGKAWIFVVIAVVLVSGICFYLIFTNKNKTIADPVKGRQNASTADIKHIEKTVVEKLKLDRKDVLIMSVMTAVYLLIALFKLGSLQAPETSWTPAKSGESFIIDLGGGKNISRITYYCGLGEGNDPQGKFKVEYLDANGTYVPLTDLVKGSGEIFRWKYADVSVVKTKSLKITAELAGAELREIGIFESDSTKPAKDVKITKKNADPNDKGNVDNLIDEQDKVVYQPSFMNSMYFDEIYHARTAYEMLHRIEPFEWTHPPLGKILIALGVALFGMTAFGWRIVGTLFGVAMIPVMYMLGKKLFKGRFYAFCTAFLMMFDFMHFTQTRIATIDVYVTFFIILMYYFMYDYFMNKSYALGFRQSLKPLFLSGLFFGLGVASKWIALYGAAGLALLFFTAKYYDYKDYKLLLNSNMKKVKRPLWLQDFVPVYLTKTFVYCILFFILIPAVIYLLSYIPFMLVPGQGHQLKDVLSYQVNIYNYHAHLKATHPFSSVWWQWPIITKPLWAYGGGQYFNLPADKVSSIFLFGNPAVWWAGIFTALASLIISIRKQDQKMVVVFTAIAAQYLPWMLVPRLTFIYHYFSIVPFIILTIVYIIKSIMDKYPRGRYAVYAYLALVALLFIWFYPILSGMEVGRSYVEHLKWFAAWMF